MQIEVTRAGLVFDVRVAGPSGGPVVVLLHGFPQSASCWEVLVPLLTAAGFRTVAPDQRGCSPRARPPRRRDYAIGELVADVAAVADAVTHCTVVTRNSEAVIELAANMTALQDTAVPATALPVLDDDARALLFTDARTANSFAPVPVPDETLAAVWELAKWPPTAANTQPLRVTYVRSEEGKARLLPLLNEGNRAKTEAAPVVALLAADVDFHEFTDKTFPIRPEMKDSMEAAGVEGREPMARFNATLQSAYFLLAARAHGLATGPMAGFDADAVTEEFFPGGRYRTLLVVNLGLPGENPWFDRLPRLAHDDVVSWA